MQQLHSLRMVDINVQTYAADGKFKNKMVYANKIGVPFVVVIGEDEVATQMVALKNMQTGEQEKCSMDALPQVLKEHLLSIEKEKKGLILED